MLKNYLDSAALSRWHHLIHASHHAVVVGHTSPDGDAMGSSLAMASYLRRQGLEAHVVMPNGFPDFLRWLPGAQEVVNFETHRSRARALLEEADLICCLDFNEIERLEDMAPSVRHSAAPRIHIDHHLNPHLLADVSVSDPDASSTAELVFSVLWQLDDFPQQTTEEAQCIYCGMMTDTGSFTYNSNRCEVFFIISQLLTKGIDKDRIFRAVYHNYSFNRLRLEGHILHDNLIYMPEACATIFTLTKEEMKRYQFKKGDAEGLVNLPLQIKGVKLSISLREDTEKPLVRVSLRSVDDFPCNRMAADFFHGGGHLNAAGGSLPIPLHDALHVARKAIEAYRELLSK